jgi:FkbM family methyltransferase
LENNTLQSKNIFINNKALSDKIGRVILHQSVGGTGGSTINDDVVNLVYKGENFGKVSAEETTLDEYAKTHTPPTVIKLDVEGAEAKVIAGGARTLRTYKPIIAMEVWPGGKGERFSMPAVRKLYDLGYISHTINDAGELARVDLIDTETINEDFDNFIFIHP